MNTTHQALSLSCYWFTWMQSFFVFFGLIFVQFTLLFKRPIHLSFSYKYWSKMTHLHTFCPRCWRFLSALRWDAWVVLTPFFTAHKLFFFLCRGGHLFTYREQLGSHKPFWEAVFHPLIGQFHPSPRLKIYIRTLSNFRIMTDQKADSVSSLTLCSGSVVLPQTQLLLVCKDRRAGSAIHVTGYIRIGQTLWAFQKSFF